MFRGKFFEQLAFACVGNTFLLLAFPFAVRLFQQETQKLFGLGNISCALLWHHRRPRYLAPLLRQFPDDSGSESSGR